MCYYEQLPFLLSLMGVKFRVNLPGFVKKTMGITRSRMALLERIFNTMDGRNALHHAVLQKQILIGALALLCC